MVLVSLCSIFPGVSECIAWNHQVHTVLLPLRSVYADGLTNALGTGATTISHEAGFFVNSIDWDTWTTPIRIGLKTDSPEMFPRHRIGVDYEPQNVNLQTDYQRSADAQTISLEIVRGTLVTDKSGWRGDGFLATNDYRSWDALVAEGTNQYRFSFAEPTGYAEFFDPRKMLNFETEYFVGPGFLKAYLWGFAYLQQSDPNWKPLNKWRITNHPGTTNEFGIRLDWFEGHPVVEFSDDNHTMFLPQGATFDLSECHPSPPDGPRITNLVLTATDLSLAWEPATNRVIVEESPTVSSGWLFCATCADFSNSCTITTIPSSGSRFYRLETDLRPVAVLNAELRSILVSNIVVKHGPVNAIFDKDLWWIETLNLESQGLASLAGWEALAALPDLDAALVMRRNQITNVAPLSLCTQLRALYLDENAVEDIGPLESLTNLTTLVANDNRIGVISSLGHLRALTYLNLCNNRRVSGRALAASWTGLSAGKGRNEEQES